jgi:hypothetical protein
VTVEDQLQQRIDGIAGPAPADQLRHDYERLLTAYEYQRRDPRTRLASDGAAAAADLGPAAYSLGVHYLAHDDAAQARYWLRIAAEHDIGDAALRLAHLCELHAVVAANRDQPQTEPAAGVHWDAARRWYARAAAAGYAIQSGPTADRVERPAVEFAACCGGLSRRAAQEQAEAIVTAAQRKADETVRRTRCDVRVVLDLGRQEVAEMARERAAVAGDLAELHRVAYRLAGLIASAHRSRRSGRLARAGRLLRWPRRRRGPGWPTPDDVRFCAQALDVLGDHPTEAVGPVSFRAALARVLASVPR